MEILIIVDVQNDFVHGSLTVPESLKAVKNINHLMEQMEFDSIIATKDWHPQNHSSFINNGGMWPSHCVASTYGSELNKSLNQEKINMIVHKGLDKEVDSYSAIFDEEGRTASPLTTYLDKLTDEKLEIYICGIALDYCVYKTAKDILEMYEWDGKLVIVEDACASINEEDARKKLEELYSMGAKGGLVR